MKLSHFLRMLVMFTIGSLIYIQLQAQIRDLQYRGEDKKSVIQKLSDDNGELTYGINRLKSANNLGIKLLSDKSSMRFLDNNHIIKVETPAQLLDNGSLTTTKVNRPPKKNNLLAGIFSLKSQAEAEPIK